MPYISSKIHKLLDAQGFSDNTKARLNDGNMLRQQNVNNTPNSNSFDIFFNFPKYWI